MINNLANELKTNQSLMMLFFCYFVSNLIYVSLSTSLSVALSISLVLYFVFNKFELPKLLPYLGLLFILFLCILISSIWLYGAHGNSKPILSLSLFFLLFFSYSFFNYAVQDGESVMRAFLIFYCIMIFLGLISFGFIPPCCGYESLEKPVFPFREQSHYSLALTVISLPIVLYYKQSYALIVFLCNLGLALFFPNLTLLVSSAVILLIIALKGSKIWIVCGLFLVVFFIYVLSFLIEDNEYFSSRLDFSETKNLTTLVWVQGIELMYENYHKSLGLGLGFQMLGGSTTSLGPTSFDIMLINLGEDSNLQDGGFFASKVVSEFGVLGLIVVLSYLISLLFIFYKIFSFDPLKKISANTSLGYGVFIGFVIEMFLRGFGYFSPSFLMFVGAIFVIRLRGVRQ